MRSVKPILKGEVRSFAVREEASAIRGCKNGSLDGVELLLVVYRHDSTTGKNLRSRGSDPLLVARWRARYSDYGVGRERWLCVRRLKGILRVTLQLVVVTVVMGTLCGGKCLHPFL